MTIEGRRSNINAVRASEGPAPEKLNRKKLSKKVKKGVDKQKLVRYTNEAVPQNGDSEAP